MQTAECLLSAILHPVHALSAGLAMLADSDRISRLAHFQDPEAVWLAALANNIAKSGCDILWRWQTGTIRGTFMEGPRAKPNNKSHKG